MNKKLPGLTIGTFTLQVLIALPSAFIKQLNKRGIKPRLQI